MKKLDEPDDAAARLLERFLELGVVMLKFWAAPRGRERGLFVDAPWRIDAARRACAAGVRVIMVHVADPDRWFQTTYADVAKFGTKTDQYAGLCRLLEEFPDLTWIGRTWAAIPSTPITWRRCSIGIRICTSTPARRNGRCVRCRRAAKRFAI